MEQLTEALNQIEQTELQQCEQVIERGLKTFVEVGNALLTIRDKRLYRATHGTFENYCQDRWGLTKSHINRTIQAAEVVSNLAPIGAIPETESQARPLTRLEPEIQREAWQQVVNEHGDNITAKKVEDVVEEWRETDRQVKEAKSNPMFVADSPEEILRKAKEIKQQQKEEAEQKRREQKEKILNQIHEAQATEHAFIYHGSCLDFIPQLDNESIDCLLTDPPYGIDFQMAKYKDMPFNNKIHNDQDLNAALELFANVLTEVSPKLKPDAHIYVFTSWKVLFEFKQVVEAFFDVKNLIIWDKELMGMGDLRYNYGDRYEVVIFAGGKREFHSRPANVIRCRFAETRYHNTQKPAPLLEQLIENSTAPGDLVFDPFLGSGSTAVAAKNTGRYFAGAELNEQNYKICLNRLNND